MMIEVGGEVMCIKKGGWDSLVGNVPHDARMPEYHGVYVVSGIVEAEGHVGLRLCGFPPHGSFLAKNFMPVKTVEANRIVECVEPA